MWPGEYITRKEMACKCGCEFDAADAELVAVLDKIRYSFNAPIIINSGARCIYHNNKVGGRKASQHLLGKAADITIIGHTTTEVYNLICAMWPDKYGVKMYASFVHVDVRPRRWRG